MLNKKINSNKSGMTLIELLAVLGIGGGMVAGALVLVGNVMEERDIKQHSENISTIFNNMQNLFSDEPMGSDTTLENLITAGVIPNSLKINEDRDGVKTSAGGDVTIVAAGDDGFVLHYNKIKAATCVEVIKGQRRVGWDTFGVAADDDNASAEQDMSGTSVSSIAGQCATGTDWVSVAFGINQE